MFNKLRNKALAAVTIISLVLSGLMMPMQAASANKTVYAGFYLTDDQENYINWEGDRVDESYRIKIGEKIYANLQEGQLLAPGNNYDYNGHTLHNVTNKQVRYNGKDQIEMMFGYYMENMVTYMDWNSAQDHTYVPVDNKPVRFPENFDYETSVFAAKEGYTFIGWYDDAGNRLGKDSIIYDNINVYARYVENDNKRDYTIEHYVEGLDGQYTLYETENKQAENE